MKVTITFLGRASDLVDKGSRVLVIEVPEGSTLKELFEIVKERISKRIGEGILEGRLFFYISVNDVGVNTLNYVLKDGDRITITTPEMGG